MLRRSNAEGSPWQMLRSIELGRSFGPFADLATPRGQSVGRVVPDKFGRERLREGQATHDVRSAICYRPVLDAGGAVGHQAERQHELNHDGILRASCRYNYVNEERLQQKCSMAVTYLVLA